jgi:hypothetical protein
LEFLRSGTSLIRRVSLYNARQAGGFTPNQAINTMAERSSLATAANVFTAPTEAFASIRERPTALLPIVLLLAGYALVSLLYMSSVDLPWFIEQQLDNSRTEMSDAQREQAIQAASSIPPIALGAIGAVTSSIAILLVMFVISLYYTGVSFATNDGIKLKHWFALTCWSALPAVLGLLASIVNILAGDARFMLQQDLNPLSFGNLFSIEPEDIGVVQRVLLQLDLTSVWAIVLMVLGYQAWTQRSFAKTVAIVLGPTIAIVVIVTLVTLP